MPGVSYWYKLGDVDNSGNITWHGPVSVKCVGPTIPDKLGIFAYPVPAKKEFTIRYEIPANIVGTPYAESLPQRITLKVYDRTGRLVKTIIDEPKHPGYYTARWNGNDNRGNRVSNGEYLLRLLIDGSMVEKIIIAK